MREQKPTVAGTQVIAPVSIHYYYFLSLAGKLLDAVVPLARHEGQGHDARDVRLRAKDLHEQAQLLADGLDVLEALLVVGTGAADPDLHLVLDEQRGDLAEGADDALECGGDLWGMSVADENVAVTELTLVKFAIPPPIKRTLPSGR